MEANLIGWREGIQAAQPLVIGRNATCSRHAEYGGIRSEPEATGKPIDSDDVPIAARA
jgi:hypothetical protein